jgi:branched-chain amino acid transport system permease protein
MTDLLLQTSLNALYAASFMALIAVGLVMIFGVMGVINFAHGELYMLGAYAVVYFYADSQLPFFLAVAAGLVFVGLVGIGMERALFRPMRDNPLGGLIVSIGFLLVLQAAVAMGFGVRMEHIPPPTQVIFHPFGLETVVVPLQRLIVIVAAVVLLGALWVFLRRSKLGWALRACAQDPEAATLQGISINQTARIAMCIGAALAGVAGALTAPLVRTYPYMGHSIIAAVLYAFVHTFVTTFADGVIADIVGLLLMLVVLVVRPTGLLGTKDRA